MNLKKIVYILSVILIIVLGFVTFNMHKESNQKVTGIDNYIIHYYYGGYSYNIKTKEEYINVEKNMVDPCEVPPCHETNVNSFRVEYKEEYIKTIENIFKNYDKKEITLTNSKLDEQDIKTITDLINEE